MQHSVSSTNDVFIIVNNSSSKIINAAKPLIMKLRDETCFFDMSKYVRSRKAYMCKTHLMETNGKFPTGLLNRVTNLLRGYGIPFNVLDERVVPNRFQHKYEMLIDEPPAYPDQVDCVSKLLSATQAIAEVPTGVGKTRIMKDVIQNLGVKTLVITPSSALKIQTYDYLHACFGTKNVGILGSTKQPKPISIMNYHSIENMDPKVFSYFDCLFYDEFHHSTNETIRTVNKSHLGDIYFRYALTATNFTNDKNAQVLMESVIANTVYSMSIPEAIEKNYIVPIIPIFVELENSHLVSQKNYQKDYPKYVDNNIERNLIARNLMETLYRKGVPTLTLVKHIKHGRLLQELNMSGLAKFINGQDEDQQHNQRMIKKFNDLEISALIGTSVIGEGVDTKACGGVINCAAGNSKQQLMQRAGRAMRKFPNKQLGFYFDFIDSNQKHLKKQSNFRMKVFQENYGVEPKIVKASEVLSAADRVAFGL